MKHPGILLQERFLTPLNISAYRLAKGLGVQQTRISQILSGQRRITADSAVRLGAFFDVSPKWFLDLQMNHDLELAKGAADEVSPFGVCISLSRTGARLVGLAKPAKPEVHPIPSDLVSRLEAQVALNPPRPHRELEEVEYPGGLRALVGRKP